MSLKRVAVSLSIIILAVFALYSQTLNYPWKHFDEQIIYRETLIPAPLSFSQFVEFISNFGLKHYIEASNPFYTTIANLRCAPAGTSFLLLIFLLFQKNVLFYHLFSLVLHILNSVLCFLIFSKITSIIRGKTFSFLNNFLVIIFTLLWSLHPVNVETVLLTSNIGAPLTYFFCLLLFYYFIDRGKDTTSKSSISAKIILSAIYLIPLLLNEYSVTLPIIIFIYLYALGIHYREDQNYKKVFFSVFKAVVPLFISLLIFSVYFLSLPKIKIFQSVDPIITLERLFWLSPQIFVHLLKVLILPIHLTIDQSSLVQLGSSVFAPYSIFCTALMYGLILFSAIAMFNLTKKRFFYPFILFVPCFISAIPFIHLISPLYNLMSERYLYMPSFFFILGILHCTNLFLQSKTKRINLFVCLSLLLIFTASATKTYSRILDWKDSFSLFSSALKEAKDNLIKGLRLQMLGALYSQKGDNESRIIGNNLILEGSQLLEQSISENNLKEQKQYPKILTFYGLTPTSKSAKAVYLLALSKVGIENNLEAAYHLLSPYIQNSSISDTQILDFYLGILFGTKRFDEAEKLLNLAYKKRISPTVFIALAELQRTKYNDLTKSETFLKESFQYFPYDESTLVQLKNFYLHTSNPVQYAYFAYLHGLRSHSIKSFEEAYQVYKSLNDTKMEKIVLNNIEILNKSLLK